MRHQFAVSLCALSIFTGPILSSGDLIASRASNEECSALIGSVQALTEAFPCVKDYCNGSSPPTPTPPTPAPPTLLPPPTVSDVQVGTYIPNWFVYKKHYMGYEMLDVQDRDAPESGLTAKWNFWAKHLEGLAPKLTHLYYAFWNLTPECAVKDSDPAASWYGPKADSNPSWIEPQGYCKGLMNDMMALKSKFPHLKLLISLGGWTYSKNFSHCAASADGQEKMYKSFNFLVNFMDSNWGKSNGIWDGLDFDWEFPAVDAGLYPDHADNDWEKYVELINYFRTRAHGEGRTSVLLTSAIGVGKTLSILAGKPSVAKGFCDALDHVNLMEYDIWGKWDSTTGHNSPFCHDTRLGNPSKDLSVLGTVNALAAGGCDLKKMHLGLANYSHAWTGVPAGVHGNGLFTKSNNAKWVGWSSFSDSDKKYIPQGIVTWWDLKDTITKAGLQVYSMDCPADVGVVVPIKHLWGNTKGMFASYEDTATIKAKAQWARNKGLGGFFFWDAQQDRNGDLLDAAREGYGVTVTHPSNGASPTCLPIPTIDFESDPITGQPPVVVCQLTNEVLPAGLATGCYDLKQAAVKKCGGGNAAPIFLGGERNGNCISICDASWGNAAMLWSSDNFHFACDAKDVQ